jgi:hypothetical protein
MGVVSSGEVVYTARGFRGTSASTLMLDQFSEDRIAADVASFVVRHDHDLFFTKTLDWQSEHEFRVTLMTNVEGEEAEFVHVPLATPHRYVRSSSASSSRSGSSRPPSGPASRSA